MKNKNKDPAKFCLECGSDRVKIIYEGLETDTYECLKCKKKYGVTDIRRLAGFTKKEVEIMDRKDERTRKNK